MDLTSLNAVTNKMEQMAIIYDIIFYWSLYSALRNLLMQSAV